MGEEFKSRMKQGEMMVELASQDELEKREGNSPMPAATIPMR